MKKAIAPIRGRLIINILISLVIIAIPTVFSIYVNSNDFKKEMIEYEYNLNLEGVKKTQSIVDSTMANVELSMKKMVESEEIINALNNTDDVIGLNRAISLLKGVKSSQVYVEDIQIYSSHSDLLVDHSGAMAYSSEREKEIVDNGIKWLKLAQNYSGDNTITSVAESGNIWMSRSCNKANSLIGYIAIKIDLKAVVESLFKEDKTFMKKDFFIINDYGSILYYNEATNIYKNALEAMECSLKILNIDIAKERTLEICENKATVFKVNSQQQPRWIYAVLDYSDISALISNKINAILKTTLGVILIVCLICVAIITVITYIPVFKIMKTLTKNNDNILKPTGQIMLNETTYIINSILHSLKRADEAEEELENRINLLQKYQTTALQMQTSPHFLFNTLDTIRWSSLEEFGENNNTYLMIENLSNLYREYFRSDNIVTTVREELHILELYMSLINIRFKNQIVFQVNVSENLLDKSCLKMCLQPIIENSIKHGLRPQRYKGGIIVSIEENNRILTFCVGDTGVGMPLKEIRRINSDLKKRVEQLDEHIGLNNVNERIKLMYGDEFGVRIAEPTDNTVGTKVYITFPAS